MNETKDTNIFSFVVIKENMKKYYWVFLVVALIFSLLILYHFSNSDGSILVPISNQSNKTNNNTNFTGSQLFLVVINCPTNKNITANWKYFPNTTKYTKFRSCGSNFSIEVPQSNTLKVTGYQEKLVYVNFANTTNYYPVQLCNYVFGKGNYTTSSNAIPYAVQYPGEDSGKYPQHTECIGKNSTYTFAHGIESIPVAFILNTSS